MSTFQGRDIEDSNPNYRDNYVAFAPLQSTKDHPEICLSLDQDNRMREPGWADVRKNAVLLSMLRPCTGKGRVALPLDHFVLEMQSLDDLRRITGFEHHEDWRPDVTCMRLANRSLSGLGCTETADSINTKIIAAEERRETKKVLVVPQQAQVIDQTSALPLSKQSSSLRVRGRVRHLPLKAAGAVSTADSSTNENQKDLESPAALGLPSPSPPSELPDTDVHSPTAMEATLSSSSHASTESFATVPEGTEKTVYRRQHEKHREPVGKIWRGHEDSVEDFAKFLFGDECDLEGDKKAIASSEPIHSFTTTISNESPFAQDNDALSVCSRNISNSVTLDPIKPSTPICGSDTEPQKHVVHRGSQNRSQTTSMRDIYLFLLGLPSRPSDSDSSPVQW